MVDVDVEAHVATSVARQRREWQAGSAPGVIPFRLAPLAAVRTAADGSGALPAFQRLPAIVGGVQAGQPCPLRSFCGLAHPERRRDRQRTHARQGLAHEGKESRRTEKQDCQGIDHPGARERGGGLAPPVWELRVGQSGLGGKY